MSSVRPRAISAASSGAAAISHTVLDVDGKSHELMRLWSSRRIVAIFMRHLGCRFCKQLAAGAKRLREELLQQEGEDKVEVVLFSIGTPASAKKWKEEQGWPGEVYVDAEPLKPSSYHYFELIRQEALLSDPRVQAVAAQAAAEGFADGEGPFEGDTKQSGGIFVLGPGFVCDYAFRSEYAGHHPPLSDVCRAATGRSADGKDIMYPTTERWNSELNVAAEHKHAPDADAAAATPTKKASSSAKPVALSASVCALLVSCAFAALPLKQALMASVVIVGTTVAILSRERLPNIPRTRVYTLGEVDRLAMKMGIDDCDCGFIGAVDVEERVNSFGRKPDAVLPTPGDREATTEVTTMLQLGCYAREFLAKPNHLVGRKGSTCPFIPTALRRDTVYMCCVYVTAEHPVEDVKAIVRSYIRQFDQLEPTSGTAALYRTLLICMPLIPLPLCRLYIDQVQRELKGEVLKKGMMIGENHLHNNGKGLHNEWYPLRTPHPCLALRHLVPGDLVFLTGYPAEVRYDFISSFVRNFETPEGRRRVSDKQLQAGRDMLEEVAKELGR